MAGGGTARPSDVVVYRSNGRILSRDNAIAIFKLRAVPPVDPEDDEGGGTAKPGRSGIVAKKFGVSPKTVRDVWNKTTWVEGFLSPLLAMMLLLQSWHTLRISHGDEQSG